MPQHEMVRPRDPLDNTQPDEWVATMDAAHLAILALYRLSRDTRTLDGRREQVLWQRHHEQLWDMKRHMDAVVM